MAEVEAWLADAKGKIARIDSQIIPLVERKARLASQVALLEKLRLTFGSNAMQEEKASGNTENVSEGSAPQGAAQLTSLSGPRRSIGAYVVAHARLILQGHGAPMHINHLYAEFLKRGYSVPGAGTAANLTAHLTRSDAIRSPKRGIYCLPEHGGKRSRGVRKHKKV